MMSRQPSRLLERVIEANKTRARNTANPRNAALLPIDVHY
jgi:hypothetical protein